MSYRALYRVFRPQRFSEVIGQEHISQTLKNALINNRLAHAYLFCGPRGTGKTSSAKILAKAVNCLSPIDGEPCNECANCQAINQDHFMDVLEIDAASNRGIDEIREIRDKVKFAPSEGKRKIYIIDEVHMLTNEAFNALLKTLEEPPEHVLFILATTDPQKIPLTILSRCQRFDFRKINTTEIRDHLAQITVSENISITEDALNTVSRKASGGMRDAISILDQCIAFAGERIESSHVQLVLGTLGEEDMIELMNQVIAVNYGQMFMSLYHYLAQGKDVKQIIRDLMEYARQLLLLKVAPQEEMINLSAEVLAQAKQQAAKVSVTFLGDMINRLNQTEKDIRYANHPKFFLDSELLYIMLAQRGDSPKKQTTAPAKNDAPAPQTPVTKAPTKKLLSAEDIIKQWQQVKQALRDAGHVVIGGYLHAAEIKGWEDDILVLKFSPEGSFHYHQMLQKDNQKILEDILSQFAGKTVKVKFFLENESGEFEQNYSLAEDAIKVFGEEKVEIID